VEMRGLSRVPRHRSDAPNIARFPRPSPTSTSRRHAEAL
jgi:hypothetical protein